MSVYHEDIVNIELNNGHIFRNYLNNTIGGGDENANRFGVRVFRNGEPENNIGSCFGLFIRADGETVAIDNGVVSGNVAYITLPEACYAVDGQFSLAIKCTGDDITGTMRIIDGVVSQTGTETAVDPGTIIPSISALIAAIDAAVETIPPDYSDLVDTVKGTQLTAAKMTANSWGTFIEIAYGDYLCYFDDPTVYGFPDWIGNSFYIHVSDKANSSGYAYKTFYIFSSSKTAGWTICGGSSSPSNLPAWNRLLRYDDSIVAEQYIDDSVLSQYETFIDIPRGYYFVYMNTAGSYGFSVNIGQSFFLEVSGSSSASGYAYKTFRAYSNNGVAMFAVCGGSASPTNLPRWNRMDGNQISLTEADITSRGYANFVEIPQGTYEILLTEPGAKGFPSALGLSFILTVSIKKHSNYSFVQWTAYGNNGTAMYAIGGTRTSAENTPVWYYLTSNNGGGSVGCVNKFSDALSPVNLLLLGDSITQGAGASGLGDGTPFTTSLGTKMIWGTGNSWALKLIDYLSEQYPNITVTNHGWGGISLSQLAQYIDEFVPEGTTHCIIGLGINSEGQTSFDGWISTIVNYLLERDIQVFAWTSWLGTHPNLSNINTAGRVQAALMHAYRNVGIEPLPVYSIAKRYIDEEEIPFMDVMEWQPDNEIVHPNDLGHTIIFRIIREGFGF